MFRNIEKIELLNILQSSSVEKGEFRDRPSHGFIFKRSGQSRYAFSKESILLSEGEVLFIPKGESYAVRKTCAGESRYVLINFHAELPDPRPVKYALSGRMDFNHFCTRLTGCMTPDTAAERYRAMALIFEFLSHISEGTQTSYRNSEAVQRIEPAVRYLRENLYDPGLLVGSLHLLCGMSDTWFRKLFVARFGASPRQYVLNKRLSHAKAILESGEYNSVAEVAQLSGFEDPLYFSKVFRGRYGHPPSRPGE